MGWWRCMHSWCRCPMSDGLRVILAEPIRNVFPRKRHLFGACGLFGEGGGICCPGWSCFMGFVLHVLALHQAVAFPLSGAFFFKQNPELCSWILCRYLFPCPALCCCLSKSSAFRGGFWKQAGKVVFYYRLLLDSFSEENNLNYCKERTRLSFFPAKRKSKEGRRKKRFTPLVS